jgi:hypothetical protein
MPQITLGGIVTKRGGAATEYLWCISVSVNGIRDFKLGGAHFKKLRRAEGGAKMLGYFV